MLQFLPTNKYTKIYNSDVSWSCESLTLHLEYLRYSKFWKHTQTKSETLLRNRLKNHVYFAFSWLQWTTLKNTGMEWQRREKWRVSVNESCVSKIKPVSVLFSFSKMDLHKVGDNHDYDIPVLQI